MIKSFFLLLCILNMQALNAQSKVSVVLIDKEKNPVENITVELLSSKDSANLKTSITDKTGLAEFENLKEGSYLLRIESINYKPAHSAVFSISQNQFLSLPAINLILKDPSELQNVTVAAKKPFIQRLSDRIVVNVENSIVNAGSTALEILERSPGITINSSDVISLKGKTGVIIMIDGKPTAMNGDALVTYLRSLPSSIIQQIDIITNPSSKYDAAGNAGIIDIRLKKNQRLGTNGTLTAGYGQGKYPKANAAVSFNTRGKKINLYGSTNFNYINWMNNLVLRRDFYDQGAYDGSYDQDNLIRRFYRIASGRIGLDYYINKKSVIGFIVNKSMNFTKRTNDNKSIVLDRFQKLNSTFNTIAQGRENSRNLVTNINFKHSYDTTGREISVDADYAQFIQDWGADYHADFYDKYGVPAQLPYILSHDQDGNLQIKSAKTDYTHPLKNGAKIEAGAKTSFVSANNIVLFFDKSNGAPFVDSSKSNHFLYNENINAFYVNFKKQWKKLEFQIGLRGEATHLKTKQLFFNTNFDTSYFQIFPTVFFNYKTGENKAMSVSAGRRIDRPTYSQLNPFRNFVDPSFYASGNPALKPQTTWAFELNYTLKNFNFELSYSRTTDVLAYVLMPTENRITLQTAVNFDLEKYMGLSVSAPIKLTKWWNSINNINLYSNKVRGFIAATIVDGSYINTIISTNNSFTLPDNWNAEVNFNFNSGHNNGIMSDKPSYGLSAGVQKNIWQNKASIRFNVSDILWKSWPRFSSRFTTYRENLSAIRDTRVANLTFNYRFGNSKVQAARRRTTASEEERRRAGGN